MPLKDGSYDDTEFWGQIQSDTPTFLGFWNHNCAPCKVMAPVFERLGKQYRDRMEFVAVNVYDRPDIAKRFGVSSTPTFIVTKRGKALRHFYGVIRERTLDQHLSPFAPAASEVFESSEGGFLSRIFGRLGRRASDGNGS